MKKLLALLVMVPACLMVAEVAKQSFVRKRSVQSASCLRQEYCQAQVELLTEATGLVAEIASAQGAMIGDVQAFVQGDGAPCDSASKGQLDAAISQTRATMAELGALRQKMRGYTTQTRLFIGGTCVGVAADDRSQSGQKTT